VKAVIDGDSGKSTENGCLACAREDESGKE